MPKSFNIVPKWWNFAESGHTASNNLRMMSLQQQQQLRVKQTTDWILNKCFHVQKMLFRGENKVFGERKKIWKSRRNK